ncbi:MAG: hypothetical protein HYU69_06345 [Bacteroidetes bacterium]|nr:hypothetical protein [Bacteroidota bacterium]
MSMKAKESSFVKLFDAMDKQKEYNEKQFLTRFKQESFTKNFRFNKHYLFNLILKSMRLYHSKGSVQAQLADMKKDLDFLYRKKLHKAGLKLLVKAQKLALKYEVHNDLVDLYKKEHVYSRYKNSPPKHVSYLNKLLTKELRALKDMENVVRYEWLSDKTEAVAIAYGEASVGKANAELKIIFRNPLLRDYKLATTTTSKLWYHLANTTYNYYNMNYQKAFDHNQGAIDIVSQNCTLSYNSYSDYLTLLSRQIVISGLLKNYSAMAEGIRLAKVTMQDNPGAPIALKIEFSLHELLYYTDTADFDTALQLVEKLQEDMVQPDFKLSSHGLQIIYYNFATVYFITAVHRSALVFVNKILQMSKDEIRPDIYNSTTLLNIIIQYELGRIQYAEELAVSAYSTFEKENMLGEMETIILELFRNNYSATASRKDTVQLFSECLEKLLVIRNIPSEKNKLQYLDFISWLKSKIQNRLLAEVIKEKVKKEKSK